MSDNQRYDLCVNFVCTECGSKLTFATGEKTETKYDNGGQWAGNTIKAFGVHPCRHCIEKHTAPAKMLAESLKELTK